MKQRIITGFLTLLLTLSLAAWEKQRRAAQAAGASPVPPPPEVCSTSSFGTAATFGVGANTSPLAVALGDVNGDGQLDAVTANILTGAAALLLGNGLGGFGAATPFVLGAGTWDVALGDVNGDGRLDLVATVAGAGKISVRLNNGMGGFAAATEFTLVGAAPEPHNLTLSDLNGDGKLDLVTADFNFDNAVVLLNTCATPTCATASFGAPASYGVQMNPDEVAVGDVNGDGKRDLAVTNHNSSSVSVLLGDGLGNFGAANNFMPGGQPAAIALGDVNGDGKLDLLTANRNQSQVAVLLNTCATPMCAAASFGTAAPFGVALRPNAIATGDFDGDSKLDVVTANLGAGNVSVLLGNGLGGFGTARNFPVVAGTRALAVSDLNGDGKLDLVTANGASDSISVLLNNCTANQSPTITALGVTRTEGSAGGPAQIATTADAEDAENTLKMEISSNGVTFANSVTQQNLTVTLTDSDANAAGTNPDATGKVFAAVMAGCGAPSFNFVLRVTDSGSLAETAIFLVTVNANTPPTLAAYPAATTLNFGAGTTSTPNMPPTDNGVINTVTATAPGFNGTLTGNPVTGAVTVSNASPAGSFTVTVAATDNCGALATTTFTLTVNALPQITGATLTRQQGSPAASAQIATVSDAEQVANTLTVTVNGGASATVNGVTVASLSINGAGTVMASVAAACTALNASFTLTVTDNRNAQATAALAVSVALNSAPTLGTYTASTTLSFGAGTTLTASSAPTDNGSLTALTASASGFNGTLTANLATGVVTVSNASPAGSFIITVTATDNCGAPAQRSFTLVVNCPTLVEVLPKPTGPSPTAAYPLPAARAGQFYTTTISANPAGANYSFSLTPSPNQLPAGLTLNSSTGVISGTTAAIGNYVFRIYATPAGGCAGASRLYSLRVN